MGSINVAEMVTALMDIMKENRIRLPHGVTMLCRGLTHVQGVLSDIAPDINMLEIAATRISEEMIKNLDLRKETEHEIRELIRALGKEHTLLFSSHILSEVQQLCDSALILHEGRLIRSFDLKSGEHEGRIRLRVSAVGTEQELLTAVRSIGCVQKAEKLPAEEKGVTELRITGKEEDERGRLTDQLFHLFAAMDAPIRRLTAEKDDLETVFLEATAG